MSLPVRRSGSVLAGALAGMLATTAPALAQSDWETEDIPDRLDDALRGLLDSVKPRLEDMFEMLGVLEQIDSPANYEKPVILPNGDILIRRSPDAPEWDPDAGEDAEPDAAPAIPENPDPDESTRI